MSNVITVEEVETELREQLNAEERSRWNAAEEARHEKVVARGTTAEGTRRRKLDAAERKMNARRGHGRMPSVAEAKRDCGLEAGCEVGWDLGRGIGGHKRGWCRDDFLATETAGLLGYGESFAALTEFEEGVYADPRRGEPVSTGPLTVVNLGSEDDLGPVVVDLSGRKAKIRDDMQAAGRALRQAQRALKSAKSSDAKRAAQEALEFAQRELQQAQMALREVEWRKRPAEDRDPSEDPRIKAANCRIGGAEADMALARWSYQNATCERDRWAAISDLLEAERLWNSARFDRAGVELELGVLDPTGVFNNAVAVYDAEELCSALEQASGQPLAAPKPDKAGTAETPARVEAEEVSGTYLLTKRAKDGTILYVAHTYKVRIADAVQAERAVLAGDDSKVKAAVLALAGANVFALVRLLESLDELAKLGANVERVRQAVRQAAEAGELRLTPDEKYFVRCRIGESRRKAALQPLIPALTDRAPAM